ENWLRYIFEEKLKAEEAGEILRVISESGQATMERKKEEKVVRKKSARIKDIKSNLKKYQLKTTPISEKDLERVKYNIMSGRSVNIYLQEETYNQLRQAVGGRKISRFINEAVLEKLNKELEKDQEDFQQKLIRGYQAMAKNKKLKADLAVWDETLGDSYNESRKPIRPCLIISNNQQNIYDEEVIALPLTTEEVIPGEVQSFEIPVVAKETGLDVDSRILTNRIHTFNKELRLLKRLGRVSEEGKQKKINWKEFLTKINFLHNLLDKFKFLLGTCIWASLGILVGGLLLVLFKNKGQLIIDNTPEFLEFCKKSNGLVFFGPIGSGKTAILAMLANELPGENKYATFPCQLP
ncbi:17875_t:CDS:2, partial [Cetraspora pellucida]